MSFKKLIALTLFMTATLSNFCFAQGGHLGGGGHLKRFHQQWILKDLFFNQYTLGEPFPLPEEFKKNLRENLIPLVEQYSGVGGSDYWNHILGDDVDIRLTRKDQFPCVDSQQKPNAKAIPLREGTPILYGCTFNHITYLDAIPFLNLPGDQQTLAILHERAHDFDPSPDAHHWIEPFIQAIWIIGELKAKQDDKLFTPLNGRDVNAISQLFSKEVMDALTRNGSSWVSSSPHKAVTRQGGGLILSPFSARERALLIDQSSYVGIGSIVTYEDGCKRSEKMPFIQKNSKVLSSRVDCGYLSSSTLILSEVRKQNQEENAPGIWRLGNGITIEQTQMKDSNFIFFTDAHLKNSSFLSARFISKSEASISFEHFLIQSGSLEITQAIHNPTPHYLYWDPLTIRNKKLFKQKIELTDQYSVDIYLP